LETGGVHIAYLDRKELCIQVPVERETYSDRRRHFNARVSLTRHKPDSRIPAFLCLDAVSASEIEGYLTDRESRIEHVRYIRLFKHAAQYLRSEERDEAATRQYLLTAAMEAGVTNEAAAYTAIDEAVRNWRGAKRGAALPSAKNLKALTPILNQVYTHCRLQDSVLARVEAFCKAQSLVPLRLAMTGNNRIVLYAEVPAAERDERVLPWGWVHRLRLDLRKTSVSEASRRFVWMTTKPDSSENILRDWPELIPWQNDRPEPMRPDAIAKACSLAGTALARARQVFRGPSAGIPKAEFSQLLSDLEWQMRQTRHRMVPDISIAIPIGVYIAPQGAGDRVRTLAIVASAEHFLYYHGDTQQKRDVERVYVGSYKDKESALDRLHHPVGAWIGARDGIANGPFDLHSNGLYYRHNGLDEAALHRITKGWVRTTTKEYNLNDTLVRWMKFVHADNDRLKNIPERVYLNPNAFQDGRATLADLEIMA